jgi:hypothetical protein
LNSFKQSYKVSKALTAPPQVNALLETKQDAMLLVMLKVVNFNHFSKREINFKVNSTSSKRLLIE